jgi:hypothetical protein
MEASGLHGRIVVVGLCGFFVTVEQVTLYTHCLLVSQVVRDPVKSWKEFFPYSFCVNIEIRFIFVLYMHVTAGFMLRWG